MKVTVFQKWFTFSNVVRLKSEDIADISRLSNSSYSSYRYYFKYCLLLNETHKKSKSLLIDSFCSIYVGKISKIVISFKKLNVTMYKWQKIRNINILSLTRQHMRL